MITTFSMLVRRPLCFTTDTGSVYIGILRGRQRTTDTGRMNQLTDLREILRYVPRFRDANFVIALDGAVIADDNFANILTDIHLLRSLNIGVLLVHGASLQIQELAKQTGRTPPNADGTGITDEVTL